jgi:PAS domain S-box-containing protein
MTNKGDDTALAVANEKNLRLLINNTDDPIWLVDTAYKIIECNESFRKWVHHFIGKELGNGDHVLYSGKDKLYLDKFEMCYQVALNGKALKSVEDMLVDGMLRYTSVSFNPVFDDEHKVIGVSCFARDITEQRRHLYKIEEQNLALREIAFIESHKIRGPVATILGLSQFFNNDDINDEVNREIIDGIVTASKQLDLVIREVVKKSNEIGPLP